MTCIVCKRKITKPKSADAGKSLTGLLRAVGKVGAKSTAIVAYCGRDVCKQEITDGVWETSTHRGRS
jgi:hypothetical protein